jgi:hypothetical protein
MGASEIYTICQSHSSDSTSLTSSATTGSLIPSTQTVPELFYEHQVFSTSWPLQLFFLLLEMLFPDIHTTHFLVFSKSLLKGSFQ